MDGRIVQGVVDDGETPSDVPDTEAAVLVSGLPYVRDWVDAEQAAVLLRAELGACGIESQMGVRARVNAGGAGVVELGWITPEVARLLAGMLAQARNAPDGAAIERPARVPVTDTPRAA